MERVYETFSLHDVRDGLSVHSCGNDRSIMQAPFQYGRSEVAESYRKEAK